MLGIAFAASVFFSFGELKEQLQWFFIVSGLSGIGVIYYTISMLIKHRIDIDVKNVRTRARLYKISVISCFITFTLTFWLTNAVMIQEILLSIVLIVGIFVIILEWKHIELSFHIAVLVILVIFLIRYISWQFSFLGVIALFLTGFSRYKLKMHTLTELILGTLVGGAVYLVILLI